MRLSPKKGFPLVAGPLQWDSTVLLALKLQQIDPIQQYQTTRINVFGKLIQL